jgi:hypothetical protein
MRQFAYKPEVCSACDVAACDICLGAWGGTHDSPVVPVTWGDLIGARSATA